MTNDKHYNSHLYTQLTRFVDEESWDKLKEYLERLSNTEFRTAGYLLGERIMPHIDEILFWKLFVFLTKYKPKAFLITSLKALEQRTPQTGFVFNSTLLDNLLSYWVVNECSIDIQKFITRILPLIRDVKQIAFLFEKLNIQSQKIQIDYLLRCCNVSAYYVLFCTIKRTELTSTELRRLILFLTRKGDDVSFNLASILTHYFDVPNLPYTFSLSILPHELNYIDRSLETFSNILHRL